jgi:peptidyl-tRNA hydrolase, PTH1 family
MKLIVGLGNPGPHYAKTRHNLGFQIVEQFAAKHQLTTRKMQFNAVTISGMYADEKLLMARPLTFMNDSGRAVGPLFRWLKLELSDLLVVYDELDLPLGKLRLRPGGGSGGHNGLKSIIANLGSEEFARMRLGIGKPVHGRGSNWVLSGFDRDELPVVNEATERAIGAIELFVERGIVAAMNQYNPDFDR